MQARQLHHRSRIASVLFTLAGHVALAMGVIGIVLPLMPTTPFVLLAAACYARGSKSFHHWLLHESVLSGYITRYREGQGIDCKLAISVAALLVVSLSTSALLLLR